MSDNSIEKRVSGYANLSAAEMRFIANMRLAASDGVGYGFMQQVTEWEWQDKGEGAWGPEYFHAEIERLTAELQERIDIAADLLVEKTKLVAENERLRNVVYTAQDIYKTLEHETAHVTALQTWRLGDALGALDA